MIAFPHSNPRLAANGFGKWATGGRNGKVILINRTDDPSLTTTLINQFEAARAGSARWAFTRTYPRIIIPTVSGYVSLTSNISITSFDMSNFTYLGFLSPAQGICFKDFGFRLERAGNAIIRGLFGRLGDLQGTEGVVLGGSSQTPVTTNVIIDRSTTSWGTDQTLSPSRGIDYTIQYCMIYETLNEARDPDTGDWIHSKRIPHGFNTLWGAQRFSSHNNFIASGTGRNPSLQTNGNLYPEAIFDHRNNVTFNWTVGAPLTPGDSAIVGGNRTNAIRNIFDVGPASTITEWFCQMPYDTPSESGYTYLWGNYMPLRTPTLLTDDTPSQKLAGKMRNGTLTTLYRDIVFVNDEFAVPVDLFSYDTRAETEAVIRQRIFDHVGFPKKEGQERNYHDKRVLDQWQSFVNTGTASPAMVNGSRTNMPGIIDTQEDVGGFIPLVGGVYPFCSFNDGIPDFWKTAKGLNVSVDYGVAGTPGTHAYLFAPSGYRWTEVYSHEQLDDDILNPDVTSILTVTSNNNAWGTVSRSPLSNPVTENTSVLLQATPATGYSFQGWRNTVTNVIVNTNLSYTFNMPPNDLSIQGVFVLTPVDPEPELPPHTLTISSNNVALGTVARSPAEGTIAEGTSVTLTATAIGTNVFQQWRNTDTNTSLSTNPIYVFPMPPNDLTIQGIFIDPTAPPPPTRGKKLKIRYRN